ncbi:hypothetical protein CDD82_673 [Ophiocordyceps australis]|uniref:O-methyltransferase domain-containing protein n=1 Tax=Ophiocordyceps australis TaxID=1399860 RepID=A0A2C5ZNT0_9HYPO|nr:hypothetical protein CDD82_673 [Ophiocordyceps australis]
MDNVTQLQYQSNELSTLISSLTRCTQKGGDEPLLDAEKLEQEKGKILAIVARIKLLVYGPTDLIQHLTSQSEILACLRWLGEFQILACIPLVESVPIEDVAGLTGVSKRHLGRVIRLTATVGFLCEPIPLHVAHTRLSAAFFSNPSLLDAAMFLGQAVVPAALQTSPAVADAHDSLEAMYQRRPRLSRQWHAFQTYAGGLLSRQEVAHVVGQLNWSKVGSVPDAYVVEGIVDSPSGSIAPCLAQEHPSLRFLVQIKDRHAKTTSAGGAETNELNPRVSIAHRAPGTRQTAADAAIYILHMAASSASEMLSELSVHVDVLRARGGILLFLTARLLPEPGSLVNPEAEAIARSMDLAQFQLCGESVMEMSGLMDMIASTGDGAGRLVVTKKLYSHSHAVVALVVKYQSVLTNS